MGKRKEIGGESQRSIFIHYDELHCITLADLATPHLKSHQVALHQFEKNLSSVFFYLSKPFAYLANGLLR